MSKWARRLIGVVSLSGGALGVAIAGQQAAQTHGTILVANLLFAAMYLWGVVAGALVLEGHRFAKRAAMFYWALQIPLLQSWVAGYLFGSGLFVAVTLSPFAGGLGFAAWAGSRFQYSLLTPGIPLVVGVNVIAVAVVTYLVRIRIDQPDGLGKNPN